MSLDDTGEEKLIVAVRQVGRFEDEAQTEGTVANLLPRTVHRDDRPGCGGSCRDRGARVAGAEATTGMPWKIGSSDNNEYVSDFEA